MLLSAICTRRNRRFSRKFSSSAVIISRDSAASGAESAVTALIECHINPINVSRLLFEILCGRPCSGAYSVPRDSMFETAKKLRQHLLTGVSFAIPFIACGGILIAISIAFAPMTPKGPDFSQSPILQLISQIGGASFTLMLPVLAGYISYSVAGKPALVAGFIGGYLSGQIKAGFLGALFAGLLAGYVVDWLKKLPVSKHIRPVMPILVIPIISSLAIGVLMLEVVGIPIANLMTDANNMLQALSTGSSLALALTLGAMIAFDMGGPVNKTAFFFGAAMIQQGDYR